MHYYKWHIGDFRKATRTLNLLQRGVYREMLDEYYESEQPLPLEEEALFDLLGVATTVERNLVRFVLLKKWIKTDEGYVQTRALAELLNQGELSAKRQASGREGGIAKHQRELKQKLALAKQTLASASGELANGKRNLATLGTITHYPLPITHSPLPTPQPQAAGGESSVSLSSLPDPVTIVQAYCRQDALAECAAAVERDLSTGRATAAEMLAKVQSCTAFIRKHAPNGDLNRLVPRARAFFEDSQWLEPLVFQHRWETPEKKESAAVIFIKPTSASVVSSPPTGWESAAQEVLGYVPDSWADLPASSRADIHAELKSTAA